MMDPSILKDLKEKKLGASTQEFLKKLGISNRSFFLKTLGEIISSLKSDEILDSIITGILVSPDPELSSGRFKELLKRLAPLEFPVSKELAKNLARLLGASNFLGSFLINNLLLAKTFCQEGDVARAAPKDHAETLREMLVDDENIDNINAKLRFYKYRELLRITYLNLTGSLDIPKTTLYLSDLADSIVSIALEKASQIIFLQGKHKVPLSSDFAVIGLGKLGGRELNYSSDIDLIYMFDISGHNISEDELARCKVYYSKLGELLTRMLSERTPEGFLYRVDLRLRPDGERGEICQFLPNMLRYYEYAGRTWERAVLLRARYIAGSISLYERFYLSIKPFIFKKYLDFGTVDDLREMKRKIALEVPTSEDTVDIKNGRGGIREIEFFVHTLALINGGKNKKIIASNTLELIERLKKEGFIEEKTSQRLKEAYILLRKIEHALQLKEERQTWKLPKDGAELRRIALTVDEGFIDFKNPPEKLLHSVNETLKEVNDIYNSLFEKDKRESEEIETLRSKLFSSDISDEGLRANLNAMGFKLEDLSLANFKDLKYLFPKLRSTAKAKTALRKLLPELTLYASISPDPDLSLANFIKFAVSVRMHSYYFTLLKENIKTLKMISNLFGTSQFLSNFLISHPELLDSLVLASHSTRSKSDIELKDELYRAMSDAKDEDTLNMLRRFNNQEILRVAINELFGSISTKEAMEELSRIADCLIYFAYLTSLKEIFFKEKSLGEIETMAGSQSVPFVIIALGKLGSREFSYKSDLDLIFLFEDGESGSYNAGPLTKLAQRIISALSLQTEEGYLYRVDMRLRPSGSQGTLVSSLNAFSSYHEARSQGWEKQALLKARFVCGSSRIWGKTVPVIEKACYGNYDPNTALELAKIKASMEKETALTGTHDFKSGAGGLLDLEFALHMLQLKHGRLFKGFRAMSTAELLDNLLGSGILKKSDHEGLSIAYDFMARLEHRIRLIKDRPISSFSPKNEELSKIAKSFSPKYSVEDIYDKYKHHAQIIRSFYLKTAGEA